MAYRLIIIHLGVVFQSHFSSEKSMASPKSLDGHWFSSHSLLWWGLRQWCNWGCSKPLAKSRVKVTSCPLPAAPPGSGVLASCPRRWKLAARQLWTICHNIPPSLERWVRWCMCEWSAFRMVWAPVHSFVSCVRPFVKFLGQKVLSWLQGESQTALACINVPQAHSILKKIIIKRCSPEHIPAGESVLSISSSLENVALSFIVFPPPMALAPTTQPATPSTNVDFLEKRIGCYHTFNFCNILDSLWGGKDLCESAYVDWGTLERRPSVLSSLLE